MKRAFKPKLNVEWKYICGVYMWFETNFSLASSVSLLTHCIYTYIDIILPCKIYNLIIIFHFIRFVLVARVKLHCACVTFFIFTCIQ